MTVTDPIYRFQKKESIIRIHIITLYILINLYSPMHKIVQMANIIMQYIILTLAPVDAKYSKSYVG